MLFINLFTFSLLCSNLKLNWNGKSGHLCLVSGVWGKAFIQCDINCRYHKLRSFLLFIVWREFLQIRNGLDFVRCFSASIEMIFFFYSSLLIRGLYWSSNVKWILHFWDKPTWLWCIVHFLKNDFLDTFYSLCFYLSVFYWYV